MVESGFVKKRQSQEMKDGVKLAKSMSWCRFLRRLCVFFVLLSTVVLLFFNINLEEMTPVWNPKWWIRFPNDASANTKNGSSSNAGVKTDVPNSNKANLSMFHQTNFTSQEETNMNKTTRTGNGLVIMVTQQTTQSKMMPPTPAPYVSPGPYLVEYPYEYHFSINEPQKCEQETPFLVLMVPLAPNNRLHRDIIRNTWGAESVIQGKVVKLFFLLGQQTGEGAEGLQQQLLQESKEHQDLIQSNFLDCYKNLTIKTMVMLEWLDSYCSEASYAMKIDSDMFLNVPNLINLLLNAPKTNYMTGLVARGGAVLRDHTSKWYVPEELYPDSQYPRYALGLGYIVSLDLPKKLVKASKHIKALYIEDVYLGLCMQYLGIPPTDPPHWDYFHVFPVTYSRCAYSRLIATTTFKNYDRMWIWQDFTKPGKYC
ncbi:Beta-1,3-galactosyltransferase 2 [Channa argus]|uniref:Hexosyltransferase n=1 Tax=Channa argus TaxID=215402 RepID=A0A6G1P951_CHAAH|nr:Beta-1,3-galactosyltransferase 2 [Channa argus]KAK2919848.1 hypothetical protein Q8A73_002052 [Channa argus]